MRLFKTLMMVLLLSLLFSCSLPPDKPVTRKELGQSDIYRTYKLKNLPRKSSMP